MKTISMSSETKALTSVGNTRKYCLTFLLQADRPIVLQVSRRTCETLVGSFINKNHKNYNPDKT